MSITLDEYESELIQATAKIVIAMHGQWRIKDEHAYERALRRDYRRIVMLAVLAYCRGVIKEDAGFDRPGVAENLRAETKDELQRRLKNEMPKSNPGWIKPNRWN